MTPLNTSAFAKDSPSAPSACVLDTPSPVVTSGIDLVPMDRMAAVVNENLKDCMHCQGHPLKLVLCGRVGIASDWKLACDSCDRKSAANRQKIQYLKRKLKTCHYTERRKIGQDISHRQIIRKK